MREDRIPQKPTHLPFGNSTHLLSKDKVESDSNNFLKCCLFETCKDSKLELAANVSTKLRPNRNFLKLSYIQIRSYIVWTAPCAQLIQAKDFRECLYDLESLYTCALRGDILHQDKASFSTFILNFRCHGCCPEYMPSFHSAIQISVLHTHRARGWGEIIKKVVASLKWLSGHFLRVWMCGRIPSKELMIRGRAGWKETEGVDEKVTLYCPG